MSNNCNGFHVNSCDCIIQWSDLLGNPSENKQLVDMIKGMLQDMVDELGESTDGKLDDFSSVLVEKVKEELLAEEGSIDPYKIQYLETTVGDALDELRKGDLEGRIVQLGDFEKGERVLNLNINWHLNKDVARQTIKIINLSGTKIIELDPDVREYVDEEVTSDTEYIVDVVDFDGDAITLTTNANFKLRYYYGANGGTSITNTEVLALNSVLSPKDNHYKHTFHCRGGNYMWYVFPYMLHRDYDFFTNGLKDTDWLYETRNVTNRFGYTESYIFFRSNNLQTALTIYSEVIAHESN